MDIINNKAVLLKLREPNKVTSAIPKSRELADNKVLVNWGLEEALRLKELKIKVPSPIEGRYEWTGRYKPFEHQKSTAGFLTMNKRSFCFNEPGTGKTASAMWASDYLITKCWLTGDLRRHCALKS